MTGNEAWRAVPGGTVVQTMSSPWLRSGFALHVDERGRWIRTSDDVWRLERNGAGLLDMSTSTFTWDNRFSQDFVVVGIAASRASSDEFFREMCGPRTP